MAIFNHLFAELFKTKSKKAYSWLLVQLVAAVAIIVLSYFGSGSLEVYVEETRFTSFFPVLLTVFATLSLFFIPVFYIITCIANERIDRSQSFRLVPIRDSFFYLDNVLSSFFAFAYYAIMNVIGIALLFAASFILNGHFQQIVRHEISAFQLALQHMNLDHEIISYLLEGFLLLVAIGFLFYFLVSFLNLSSSAIVDFLPNVSGQFALKIVRGTIIIFIAWFIVKAKDLILFIVFSPFDYIFSTGNNHLLEALILVLVVDIVLLLINTVLISKFFEAQEKR